jgi:hypothetical protein
VRPLRHDPERAAIALRDAAFRAGSIDNISVVVVVFPTRTPGGSARAQSSTTIRPAAAIRSTSCHCSTARAIGRRSIWRRTATTKIDIDTDDTTDGSK